MGPMWKLNPRPASVIALESSYLGHSRSMHVTLQRRFGCVNTSPICRASTAVKQSVGKSDGNPPI